MAVTESHPRRNTKKSVRVEPMATLEWSQAVELAGVRDDAAGPEDIRRAWIHRAPERQVVGLYRVLSQFEPELPAPWWLRALAAAHGVVLHELSPKRGSLEDAYLHRTGEAVEYQAG